MRRAPRSKPDTQGGYTLAFVLVLITVMNIALAAAMPVWSTIVQRDKEAELIFRGMQYAEAIRVFQRNHSRFPNSLEELVKVEPRSIRQLFPEPMDENGEWGLLILAPGAGGVPGAVPGAAGETTGAEGRPTTPPGQPAPRVEAPRGVGAGGQRNARQNSARNAVPVPPSGEKDSSGRSTRRTTGAIVGVYSASTAKGFRTFLGFETYDQWRFTFDLVPMPLLATSESAPPRVTSAWVGKAFRSDLVITPQQVAPRDLAAGSGPKPARARDFRPRRPGDRKP